MAFILFETGSAKWVKAFHEREPQFHSTASNATQYNEAVWTLEAAIKHAGVQRYANTIVAHDIHGREMTLPANKPATVPT